MRSGIVTSRYQYSRPAPNSLPTRANLVRDHGRNMRSSYGIPVASAVLITLHRTMHSLRVVLFLFAAGCASSNARNSATQKVSASSPSEGGEDDSSPMTVLIPGGEGGIGFDDLRYSSSLHRVLVPGGRAGVIAMIEPKTGAVETIDGFSKESSFGGGHDFGVTSVDEGSGFLFATDRTSGQVHVVDPHARTIVSSTSLRATPDYVRYVATTSEVWVTEPGIEKVEIFSVSKDIPPKLRTVGTVTITNGPESLVIDSRRARAYTHRWSAATVAIDVIRRTALVDWGNGCAASRGIDIDAERGLLFAVCSEGKASVLDLEHGGAILGTITHGSGFDVIGYSSKKAHLYAAGHTLSVFGVDAKGGISLIADRPSASGAHCAVTDDVGHAWFCDPHNGSVVRVTDGSVAAP